MRRTAFAKLLIVLALPLALAACTSPNMNDTEKARHIIDGAHETFQSFWKSQEEPMDRFRQLWPDAQGVIILPGVIKGGFVLAAEGGNGVLMARDASGRWGEPAFYTLASGSIGLQIGGQSTDVILLVFSTDAVKALIESQGKIGADLGLIIGTVGAGVEAATTANVGADILAFSHGIGVFGGGSLEASALIKRRDFNAAYYGQDIGPGEIILNGAASNPASDRLKAALDAPQ